MFCPGIPSTWLAASVPSELKDEGQEASVPLPPPCKTEMAGVGGAVTTVCTTMCLGPFELGCVYHNATLWLCGLGQVTSSKPQFSHM